MVIAIDFDGTVVKHAYPEIGEDVGSVSILKKLLENGHKIILNTMRSGKELQDAVNWFKGNGIDLYGVNENPTQNEWTSSPKVYAQLYIDDAALGCPLVYPLPSLHEKEIGKNRPYVDWKEIEKYLIFEKIIK